MYEFNMLCCYLNYLNNLNNSKQNINKIPLVTVSLKGIELDNGGRVQNSLAFLNNFKLFLFITLSEKSQSTHLQNSNFYVFFFSPLIRLLRKIYFQTSCLR
jgi:hypothetical protein